MKSLILVLSLIACLALTGCKQNPYGDVSSTPGQKVVTENPENNHQAPKVFSIEAPDVLECNESATCGTTILGHVPNPGNSIVQIKGLPSGATYDASTGAFSYTPDYDVVDVSKHPEQSMVNFPLTVTVRSSADSVNETSRIITLIVKNKMQPVDLEVSGSSDVDEGTTLEQTVEVKSADFPQGPFSLSAINAPVGTEVKPVSGSSTLFKVRFTPGFSFSTYNNSKSVKISYTASLPIGQSISKDETWTIDDVRQAPAISAPENITQGLDVNFSIRAEDLNGEVSPKITVSSVVPFGRISSTTVTETTGQNGTFPSKVVIVRWDQLKTSQLGTTTPINYEVCVQRGSGSYSFCTQKKVMVTLKADVHPTPKIDRVNWKLGDLKFLKAGSPFTIGMPIFDVEDQKMPVDVKINSNQANAVSWSNGVLTINPIAEGILQFGIQAESIFGQKMNEDFVVEVLPSTWAKTVFFTSDSVQNETLETAKLTSSVELLSAKFQVFERNLALRESCVFTTEALGLAKADESLQNKMYQKVSSLIVSSPLANNLKGKIQDDLKSFGIKVLGRLSSQLSHADLSSLTLVVDSRSSLESPKVPAGLKGTLSSESMDPMVFDLSRMSSNCVALFNLQKPAVSLAVGFTCKHNNGKTLTVLGFELADVLLNQSDSTLMGKWMNAFLTGKAN